jgi:hypothetical protein
MLIFALSISQRTAMLMPSSFTAAGGQFLGERRVAAVVQIGEVLMAYLVPARRPSRLPIGLLTAAFGSTYIAFGTVLLSIAASADATTWVRGRGQVPPGSQIDPLYQANRPQPLIPTISTGQFTDAQKGVFSQADLGNAALRARAYVAGGSGSVSANPELGDRLTFNNITGAPSTFEFSYDIDGTIKSGATPFPVQQTFPGVGTFKTTFVQFAVHIFAGGTVGPSNSGARSWNNHLGEALFSQTKDLNGFPTSGTISSLNNNYSDNISGSVPVPVGLSDYDIVLVLAVAANVPSGVDSSIDMDFRNTALLDITSSPGYFSESNVFLTGVNIVPEPATLGLMAMLVAATRRRRRLV